MANKKKEFSPEEIAALKQSMDVAEVDFSNAKIAYYTRGEYKGQMITYEVLRTFAESFIQKNYAVQKAVFGKIHVKLLVANLMRE
jgi:hypothetical protein